MSISLSLDELIAAVTGAVTKAQDAVHKHQLALLSQYFDSKGRPLSFNLTLPDSSRLAGPDMGRQVVVPLLSVVEPSLLSIAEFSVDFDVVLTSLVTDAAPASDTGGPERAPAAAGAPVDVPAIVREGEPKPEAQAEEALGTADPAPAAALAAAAPAPMRVGLATRGASEGPLARLSIKVEGRRPTEGLIRLIDALNKTI